MNLLTVPEIDSAPQQTNGDFWVVHFPDFLLTQLLRSRSTLCALHARDAGGDSVAWSIGDQVVATIPRRLFRAVLARFGVHYMGGQPYAGYTFCELEQKGLRSTCHFYLGNCGDTGFWIEVYARKA